MMAATYEWYREGSQWYEAETDDPICCELMHEVPDTVRRIEVEYRTRRHPEGVSVANPCFLGPQWYAQIDDRQTAVYPMLAERIKQHGGRHWRAWLVVRYDEGGN